MYSCTVFILNTILLMAQFFKIVIKGMGHLVSIICRTGGKHQIVDVFNLYLHTLSYFLTVFSLSHGLDLLPLKMIIKATFSEGGCPPAGLTIAICL